MDPKKIAVSMPQTDALLQTINNKPLFRNAIVSFVYMTLVPQSAIYAINLCFALFEFFSCFSDNIYIP